MSIKLLMWPFGSVTLGNLGWALQLGEHFVGEVTAEVGSWSDDTSSNSRAPTWTDYNKLISADGLPTWFINPSLWAQLDRFFLHSIHLDVFWKSFCFKSMRLWLDSNRLQVTSVWHHSIADWWQILLLPWCTKLLWRQQPWSPSPKRPSPKRPPPRSH